MSRVIHSLSLRNFRSFSEACLDLPNPTFLVGRNGAGKSGILDAIQLLSDCVKYPLSMALQLRGGISAVRHRTPGPGKAPKLAISVDFQRFSSRRYRYRYGFELAPLAGGSYKVASESCLRFMRKKSLPSGWNLEYFYRRNGNKVESNLELPVPIPDPGSLSMPFLAETTEFSALETVLGRMSVIDPQISHIREPQPPSPLLMLDRTAANLASILDALFRNNPRKVERLNEFLAKVADDTSVIVPSQRGSRLSVQFEQSLRSGEIAFDASSMSDGTLRVLGVLASVFQIVTPSVLCVEEPEASIHPGALDVVLDALALTASQAHLLVSTQSPVVLNNPMVLGESLRVVQWKNGSSQILPVAKESLDVLNSHLFGAGELLQANQLTAGRFVKRTSSLFGDETWSSN